MRVIDPLDDILNSRSKLKILRHMVLYPSEVTTGRRLAEEIGMQTSTCNNALNSLCEAGIINRKRAGRSYIYNVARETQVYKNLLLHLFNNEAAIVEGVADTLTEGFGDSVAGVYLFGSTARGEDTLESDTDVLIVIHDDMDKRDAEEILSGRELEAYREYHTGFNVVLYTESELEKKKQKGDRFVTRTLDEAVPLKTGGRNGQERQER